MCIFLRFYENGARVYAEHPVADHILHREEERADLICRNFVIALKFWCHWHEAITFGLVLFSKTELNSADVALKVKLDLLKIFQCVREQG